MATHCQVEKKQPEVLFETILMSCLAKRSNKCHMEKKNWFYVETVFLKWLQLDFVFLRMPCLRLFVVLAGKQKTAEGTRNPKKEKG